MGGDMVVSFPLSVSSMGGGRIVYFSMFMIQIWNHLNR
jgi:hypothetical protein